MPNLLALTSHQARTSLVAFDAACCLWCIRVVPPRVVRFMRVISRMGDGWIWYAHALLLPFVVGTAAWPVIGQLLVTAVIALPLYRRMKHRFARERPYITHRAHGLLPHEWPMDRYSFPSGHTLHSWAFSVVLIAAFPVTAWWLVPFTLLVGPSRVVLGLHHPTDIAAGALIGVSLASVVLLLI
ncbi:MAG: phosphatase PAP2 family protein [Acidobacteriota bacterium]